MELYEVNKRLDYYKENIKALNKALNPKNLQTELAILNKKMLEPDFWNDTKTAKKVTKDASIIQNKLQKLKSLEQKLLDIISWLEIAEENTEEWQILEEDINNFEKEMKDFEIETLLSNPYDENNAILEIHSGAGGTEAQDWCEMLFRMFSRYTQKKNYKTEILDIQHGEEAGLKSVTMLIKGEYAYGYLKAERGVHRLVRISPFDSNQRRHTSFASVEVMPEIDDDIDIELNDEDLKIDVYRSGGAGGQSVNTTDSAVRITHLPTNIVVTCQNERSQLKNKEQAIKVLKAKLVQIELIKKEEELNKIKGELKDIAWGSQIRSYVFHPYQMVKDHRTNYETSQIDDVMDGELDGFINSYLKSGD